MARLLVLFSLVGSLTALARAAVAEDIYTFVDSEGVIHVTNVPDGDRIFRLPYLDPKGRMTIAQWNTARLGTDYRLAPLQAVSERFTWKVPQDVPPGPVTVTARLWYSRLVSSVAEYLKVPPEEWQPVQVNEHSTTFVVVD